MIAAVIFFVITYLLNFAVVIMCFAVPGFAKFNAGAAALSVLNLLASFIGLLLALQASNAF